jgi:hypothetical protein
MLPENPSPIPLGKFPAHRLLRPAIAKFREDGRQRYQLRLIGDILEPKDVLAEGEL